MTAYLPSRAVLAALALTALAGCAVKAPPINRWTLGGTGAGAATYDADGPALGVAAVTSVAEIRTTSLVWRSEGGRRLDRHPTEQWADYPDHLVEGLLTARLASTGAFSAVRATPPTRDLDWVLECELLDFTEWDGPGNGQGHAGLRCLLSPRDGGPPRSLEAVGRVATPASTAAGMVEGIASAARQAVDDMVAQVRTATAAR